MLGFICNIGSIALLTRYLSKTEFGFFSLLVSVITVLVIIVTSSVSDFAVKEISSANSQSDKKRVREVVYFCCIVSLTTIITLSIAILLANFIDDNLTVSLSFLIILSVFGLSYITIIGSMLRGLGFPIIGQIVNVVFFPAFFLAVIIAAIYFSLEQSSFSGVDALLARFISSYFGLFLAITLFVLTLKIKVSGAIKPKFRKEWLPSSLEFLKIGFLGSFNRQVSIYILAFTATISMVSDFRLVLLGLSVFEQISAVGLVMLQAKFAQGKLPGKADDFKIDILQIYGSLFLISVLGLMIYIIFGKYLIITFFGNGYSTVYWPLFFAIFGHIGNLMFGPVGIFMTMRGHAKTVAMNLFSGVFINIVLSTFFIIKFGVSGAVFGLVIGTFTFSALSLFSCRENLSFNPSLISSAYSYLSYSKK